MRYEPTTLFAQLSELIRTGRLLTMNHEQYQTDPLDGCDFFDISAVFESLDSDVAGAQAVQAALPNLPLLPGPRIALMYRPDAVSVIVVTLEEVEDPASVLRMRGFGLVPKLGWRAGDIDIRFGEHDIEMRYLQKKPESVSRRGVGGCYHFINIARHIAEREIEFVYDDAPTPERTRINDRRRKLGLEPIASAKRILHLRERKIIRPQVEPQPMKQEREPYDYFKLEWHVTRTLRGGGTTTYVSHRRKELLNRPKKGPKPWYVVKP